MADTTLHWRAPPRRAARRHLHTPTATVATPIAQTNILRRLDVGDAVPIRSSAATTLPTAITPASATITTAAISSSVLSSVSLRPRRAVATAATSAIITNKKSNSNKSSSKQRSESDSSGDNSSGSSSGAFQQISYFHRHQVRKILDKSTSDESAYDTVMEMLGKKYDEAAILSLLEYYKVNRALDDQEIKEVLAMRELRMPWLAVANRFGRTIRQVRNAQQLYEASHRRQWSEAENEKLLETVANTRRRTQQAGGFWASVAAQMKLGRWRFRARDALSTKEHYDELCARDDERDNEREKVKIDATSTKRRQQQR